MTHGRSTDIGIGSETMRHRHGPDFSDSCWPPRGWSLRSTSCCPRRGGSRTDRPYSSPAASAPSSSPCRCWKSCPSLDPDRFPPVQFDEKTKSWRGGWIEKYGFLPRRGADEPTIPPTEPELAQLLKDDPTQAALPVGFSLSNYRPFSPDASPVKFVGVACAGCHSNRLPDRGPNSKLIYGAGNSGLDLIGFFESFRAVLLAKKPRPSLPPERTRDRSITEGPDLSPADQEYVLSLSSLQQAQATRASRSGSRGAGHDSRLAHGSPELGRDSENAR